MSKSVITMTYEAWFEAFKPMKNPTDPDAPFDGCLIDTSKEEMAWVAEHNRLKVWTLLESDGVLHISEGVHFVNRMGYFVTEVPRLRPDQQFYEVLVSDEEEVEWEEDAEITESQAAMLPRQPFHTGISTTSHRYDVVSHPANGAIATIEGWQLDRLEAMSEIIDALDNVTNRLEHAALHADNKIHSAVYSHEAALARKALSKLKGGA